MIFLVAFLVNAQDFKVLLVDDDNNTVERGPIDTALNHNNFTYAVTNAYDAVPTFADMEQYDVVLWYTGNDGTTNLWQSDNNENSKFKQDLIEFAKNGGIVWLDGLDFLYNVVGTAPDTFPVGSFIYDTLGISIYKAQSYADDGNNGVAQYDISAGNTITSIDPVTWVYSSLYYADGLAITSSAHALYQMQGGTYPLAGQITALYNQVGNSTFITSGFRLAKIKTQNNIDAIVGDILNYAKNNWDSENNSIAPTNDQAITVNNNGTTLTVSETVGWDSREWKYSTTSGGPYQSFSTPETGKSYTPNFSSTGTYYVVCETTYGSTIATSNEVKITVTGYTCSISPETPQFLATSQDGQILTATENDTPDSREWKFSTTSGSGYQSFSPAETNQTFTPNFTNKGIYYVVCQSTFGATTVTSNEVKILVDTNTSDYILIFDGDDSFYVKDENQDYINISDNWTIETWVRVDDYQSGTYPVIMDRDKCFSMYVQADNDDDFSIAFVKRDASDNIVASLSSANLSSVEFKFGEWYHIAAQYNGTTAKLFINGNEIDNSTDDFSLLAATSDYINIGCRYRSDYERFLTGAMENIQMSKTARYSANFTPQFFAQQHADTNSVFCLNLEAGAGSNLFDFSGHFDNISLRNSPNNPDWAYKYETSVNPQDDQSIDENQDGTPLSVTENAVVTSREWKYSTTSGNGYQSFSPVEDSTVYVPNFSTAGTYYVVCQSVINGQTITSNEVKIDVLVPASITTGTINGSPFYVSADSSAAVDVPYTITGTFNSGNVFTAYLSDANGTFTTETEIGGDTSTTAGTISATIPAGTNSGDWYRIRVKSSDPAVTGTDNGTNLQVILVWDSISPVNEQFIDINQNGTSLNVSEPVLADSREWKFSTTQGGPYQSFSTPETGLSYTPNFSQAGTYYIVCQSVFDGGNIITTSNEVKINVLTNYKILFINDDNNGDESEAIDTALAHTGYSYVKVNTTDSVPSYDFMQNFDFVFWHTGNDGTTNIWDADSTFLDAVEQYVDNGGTFWLDGVDFIYDNYGTAPVDFEPNSFIYQKLGISKYLSQTYADDGSNGVPQMDITTQNKITSENPITWQYSSLWYADGLAITDKAIPLYVFGDENYTFAGQVNTLYKQQNYGTYLTSGLRIARLGDGSNFVQDSVDKLFNEIIAYDQQTPVVYCGNIDPTVYYVTATNGANVVVPYSIDGGFDFNSSNVFTAYLSDATGDFTNETAIGSIESTAGDTIFAIIPSGIPSGNNYRIRVKASDPNLTSNDNGVDIQIIRVNVAVTPVDTQRIDVGQIGTQLTVTENPTADSREWKFATTSGGSYQSFDTPETNTTYTPQFSTAGTYFVVCQSVMNGYTVNSNEVVIIVSDTISITTETISGSPFTITDTTGANVDVPFTATGNFENDNIFTAYLSDANGSFDDKIAIGTTTDTNIIAAIIPAGTPSGTHYRIRVESSSPVFVGTDNGSDLTINLDTTTQIIKIVNININIYPNPVNDILFIDTENNRNFSIQIIDNLGRTVIEQKLNKNFVDVSNLSKGVYTLIISDETFTQSIHFIKM